jgi:hypothetical protein
MGFHEVKRHNCQTEETLHKTREKSLSASPWTRDEHSEYIKCLKKLNTKRINNLINKQANKMTRQFSKEVQMNT